jgi:CheY-like chemotaxis protein
MLTDLMGGEMQVSSQPGRGRCSASACSCPRCIRPRLPGSCRVDRIGYAGVRRRILVVDNERWTASCCTMLEPLGFIVEQAASGECLAIVPRLAPDVIFMDLGMPGIDGWETIRRLRQQGLGSARLAILSANAFDKNLDNDVGIGPDDFIVKPFKLNELLDWIGRVLELEWVSSGTPPPAAAPAPTPPPLVPPGRPSWRRWST